MQCTGLGPCTLHCTQNDPTRGCTVSREQLGELSPPGTLLPPQLERGWVPHIQPGIPGRREGKGGRIV